MPANAAHPPNRQKVNVAGLFAGIGGFELGFRRAGFETTLFCEIDPSAVAVLENRFSGIPIHEDISTLRSLPQAVDVVVAGFPCQDLSQAGRTAGIDGSRSGLIEEVLRLLKRKRVSLVVLENVPFMLQLAKGRALEIILSKLELLGYRWAYRVVDTRAFGLPQRRQRVFIVAALEVDPRGVLFADEAGEPSNSPRDTDTACGFYWTEGIRGLGWAVDAIPTLKGGSTVGIPSPPAIVMPGGEIVTPDVRDAERMQGFAANWTQPAEKVSKKGHRWKLVGNAVTVDVAEWIGSRLLAPGSYESGLDLPLRDGGRWPRAAWNIGEGRFASSVSTWPFRRRAVSLETFLEFPTAPLSARATAGFLARTRTSSLRFPPGFIESVEQHLESMRREAIPA